MVTIFAEREKFRGRFPFFGQLRTTRSPQTPSYAIKNHGTRQSASV